MTSKKKSANPELEACLANARADNASGVVRCGNTIDEVADPVAFRECLADVRSDYDDKVKECHAKFPDEPGMIFIGPGSVTPAKK